MRFTLMIVRAYGTADQWGDEPRTRPTGAPLVFQDFPLPGYTARIDFGPVPDDVAEAERGRRAVGRMMLTGGVFGGDTPEGTPDERFDAATATVDLGSIFGEHNWYSTISVSKEIDVPDEAAADIGFAMSRDAYSWVDAAVAEVRDGLDVLAAVAATVVSPRAFVTLVLEDRPLLFAEGRKPAGVPIPMVGGVSVSMTMRGESVTKLTARLKILATMNPLVAAQEPWLARVAHWRMQTLLETDPWKRYQWAFVGLEMLTHKLYDRVRGDVVSGLRLATPEGTIDTDLPIADLLWSPERAPLAGRFAAVATAFFPASAVEDVRVFREVKDARDRLSHGSIRNSDELPSAAVVDLFGKYVDAALKRFVFGLSPASDWEEGVSDDG